MSTLGIDVSNNNGPIDWASVAHSGVKWARLKATEGLTFVDEFYAENRKMAKAHGIHVGAYHFFTPGEDPAAQVQFFLDRASPTHGELLPWLDYEKLPADRAPAEAFVVAMRRELGYYPMFYSYLSFIETMRIPATSPLAQCPLALSDFTSVRPAPPKPWHEIVIWQRSSTGRMPGIGGPVDLDSGGGQVIPTPKPDQWVFHYRTANGKKETHTTKPGHGIVGFLSEHPKLKFNGRIIIDPVTPG